GRAGASMTGRVLRMNGVGVRRDGAELLRGVDWTVEEDERWVVLGPNGAGKTTLLAVAATEQRPAEGGVELLEESLDEADPADLRPLVGFAGSAVANRVPDSAIVLDLVISASYGLLGRFGEE